jgi:hypothetical protein
MRLVTRGDLDGLVASVLISKMEDISRIELVHPQHITDNIFHVESTDILAKVPYHPNCAMWFSHRELSENNLTPPSEFKGSHALYPSVSKLIYDYYSSSEIEKFEPVIQEVDRFESANLILDDVENPQGVIQLGFLIDPRTSFGPFKVFFYSLHKRLKQMGIEELLAQPDIAERVTIYKESQEAYKKLLKQHTTIIENVILTDFRELERVPIGNRFLIYAMHPNCNVSVRLQWGPKKNFIAATLGRSIFNRTCCSNLGDICSDYGGGGHSKAGSCPLEPDAADMNVKEIIDTLVGENQ